jgi:iron-sulfur cluster repair protein YtfE (RIC family)
MSATEQFRSQHKEILTLTGEIGSLCLSGVVPGNESTIKAKLNALSGILSVHLAMEDRTLYPAMINGQNPAAKNTASAFKDQMGGIAGAFKSFVGRYPTGKSILDHAAAFGADFKAIRTALQTRISKEESVLYPLADKL